MICMLVLIYYVMYIHVNCETISRLIYEQTLQSETIVMYIHVNCETISRLIYEQTLQSDTISNKKEDNIDMVSKLKKFAIEAKQN